MGKLLGRHQRGSLANRVALSGQVKKLVSDKAVRRRRSMIDFAKTIHDHELSWTLNQDTEIHTILVWHTATWFCASARTEDEEFQTEATAWRCKVATELSSYCAYLVAFHPELLPGHHTITTSIFDTDVKEAEVIFQGTTSPDERYKRVQRFVGSIQDFYERIQGSSDHGIHIQGFLLGRQLMDMDDGNGSYCWEIMADFWAEMLLLVAQSDNATAHIEHLAQGGEFVTHLWALLYNAGMHKDRIYIGRNKDDGKKSRKAFQGKGKGKGLAK